MREVPKANKKSIKKDISKARSKSQAGSTSEMIRNLRADEELLLANSERLLKRLS